jgi:hypothetical protein
LSAIACPHRQRVQNRQFLFGNQPLGQLAVCVDGSSLLASELSALFSLPARRSLAHIFQFESGVHITVAAGVVGMWKSGIACRISWSMCSLIASPWCDRARTWKSRGAVAKLSIGAHRSSPCSRLVNPKSDRSRSEAEYGIPARRGTPPGNEEGKPVRGPSEHW